MTPYFGKLKPKKAHFLDPTPNDPLFFYKNPTPNAPWFRSPVGAYLIRVLPPPPQMYWPDIFVPLLRL